MYNSTTAKMYGETLKLRAVCQLCFIRNLSTSGASQYKKPTGNLKGKDHQWLHRQLKDPYVARARTEGFRCRSAFKLLEMDDKHRILRPGHVVLDCGAAPGSWTQVAVERVKATTNEGTVVAIDLQQMRPIEGATCIQGDFSSSATQRRVKEVLAGRRVDVLLSDMAPNASGTLQMDHENIMVLCAASLRYALIALNPGGTLLCKIWQGYRQPQFQSLLKAHFKEVKVVKPVSSRSDSAEVYLLSKHFHKPALKE